MPPYAAETRIWRPDDNIYPPGSLRFHLYPHFPNPTALMSICLEPPHISTTFPRVPSCSLLTYLYTFPLVTRDSQSLPSCHRAPDYTVLSHITSRTRSLVGSVASRRGRPKALCAEISCFVFGIVSCYLSHQPFPTAVCEESVPKIVIGLFASRSRRCVRHFGGPRYLRLNPPSVVRHVVLSNRHSYPLCPNSYEDYP